MFDCIVVGGGPAGLIAATYLGRYRRRFLVIDAGEPRARWIPVSHNTPGFPDGISGPALLARLREQAEQYGASFQLGTAERIDRLPGGGFALHSDTGVLETARVLLATGSEDIAPRLAGLADVVREGLIRYCPICDAYETIGRTVGLIGYGECRLREALLLRAYTPDITVLTLGEALDLPAEDEAELRDAGVAISHEPVTGFRAEDGSIVALHANGRLQRFDMIYAALGLRIRSGLALDLGAEADEDGALIVDTHQETSIPGLFAAGDVVRGLSQLGVAAGHAAIAATAINRSLPFPVAPGRAAR